MPESGFSRPDLPNLISTIRSDLLTRFESDVVLRRLDAEVYARVMAAAAHTLYGYIDYLAKNMLPDLCDETWLVRHANLKRSPRKQPTTAGGYMRWEGVSAEVPIPSGTEIQTDDQTNYVTTGAQEFNQSERVLRVPVEAVSSGSAGNLDDGTPLRLLSPITGLSVTGYADSVQGGTDLEDLEEWRSRVMARWYYTPQGGADSDYVAWATDVAGISRAWVFRNQNGPGTVGVMVATNDPDNPAPDPARVAAARDYILPLAPVAGASLSLYAAKSKIIPMEIALAVDSEASRVAVVRELKATLLRDGSPSGRIYHSHLGDAVSRGSGGVAYRIINPDPDSDTELAADELPVLGDVKWSSYGGG